MHSWVHTHLSGTKNNDELTLNKLHIYKYYFLFGLFLTNLLESDKNLKAYLIKL